ICNWSCISTSLLRSSPYFPKAGRAMSPAPSSAIPYDRAYSGFLQLQRDIREQPAAPFPNDWIKALVMRQLADNQAQLAAGDFEFDKWFALVEEHQIYEVGRNSSFPLHPAHYWTGIDRERKVDFIGKVECFERDFDAFCGRVGIEPEERASINVSDRLPEPQSP